MKHNHQAFTLIELLVVVLIVGILATVALPQYKRAVDRSRFAEMIQIASSLKRAEEVYFLANGEYTTHLEDLDIEYPLKYDEQYGNYEVGKGAKCAVAEGALACQSRKMSYAQWSIGLEWKNLTYCFASKEHRYLCESMGGKNGVEYKPGSWRYKMPISYD
ncbi:MAG: prepilin-type N-terminal cleavage/methylation domain-containing protein [Elusimicrobiaceae bacterium]|nr:prepilin-type N-terminal cleavage/methylation domain-containing protein [Elusimicrobiaceae bacterium]